MSLPEHLKQDLVVGLYDRSAGLPSENKVLDIGTSKILKSGIWSPYLVNFRPVLSEDVKSPLPIDQQQNAKGLLLKSIGSELDEFEEELGFFHIFGLPEAGTPLASAVAGATQRSLLWQRVKPKVGYGSHSILEGVVYEGQQVVQIDDVVTTGATKREGVEFLNKHGLSVPGVVIGMDREQGGAQSVEAMGMKVKAALGATASFGYLLDAKRITKGQHDYLVEYTHTTPYPTAEPANFSWKS